MADVAQVKAEIKAWERAFRQNNARDPTVDDIRSQPAVAEKYKLYKKLAKSSSSIKALQSKPKDGPSTPPRGKSTSASLLASTSRVAQNTAPLPAFNPFSPQKKKAPKPQASRTGKPSRGNLFASPVKGKSARTTTTNRLLSPDPFSEIAPSAISLRAPLLSQHTTPEISNAVSRARKRLRGDPVSPSPDKRRRLTATPLLAMPRPGESDDEDDPMSGELSFVDDSPMKAPAGFTKLFDEAQGGRGELKRTSSFALFGAVAKKGAPDSDDEMDTSADGVGPPKLRSAPKLAAKKFSSAHAKTFGNPMHLAKDNLFAESGPGDDKPAAPSKPSRAPKRSSSRAMVDQATPTQPLPPATHEETVLIPPSPPPADSNRRPSYMNGKGKGAARTAGRKKIKVNDEDGSTSDADEQVVVKVFNRHPTHAPHEDDDDFDGFDPALLHTSRDASLPRAFDANGDAQATEETLEINLPEDLRRILDIAPEERTAREERRLAEGLVYGRRVGHYDAGKGGEIWDVGEDDEAGERDDAEEDWEEGEGVPWAAGEL